MYDKFLLIFVLYFQLEYVHSQGHAGTTFAVMFPEGIRPATHAELLISADRNTTVRITSNFPGVTRTLKVNSKDGAVISLPPAVVLSENRIENKGIIIDSESPISVAGYSGNDCCYGEGFSALPERALGYSYSIATQYNSTVSVVAIEDDTEVNITKGFWGGVPFESEYYRMGETIRATLMAGQTLQLKSVHGYLIGSKIKSDKPIGVMSGQYYSTLSRQRYNHMIEYIPPEDTHGNNFIVPPIFNATYVSMIYSNGDKDNTIRTKGRRVNSESNLRKRGSSRISTGASIPYHGSSIEPLLLSLYPFGISPFMMLVPSIDQYSNNYIFITPTRPTFKHFIVVIAKSGDIDGLRLDGEKIYSKIDAINVLLLENSIYLIISTEITHGQHSVYHIDDKIHFGLVLYGFDDTHSYGYPLGLNLKHRMRNVMPLLSLHKPL